VQIFNNSKSTQRSVSSKKLQNDGFINKSSLHFFKRVLNDASGNDAEG
jgi:hypothetical protein